MEFTVPQFIEEESKIIGPLSFRQSAFIGVSVAVCIVVYFSVSNFFIFLLLSAISLGIGASLALLKINRTNLPVHIKNYFIFMTGKKVYLWQKEERREENKISKKSIKKKEDKKNISIPLTRKSNIQNLSVKIGSKKNGQEI